MASWRELSPPRKTTVVVILVLLVILGVATLQGLGIWN